MDIEELKNQKCDLESRIADWVDEFCEKTGVRISDIRINVIDASSMDQKGKYIYSVRLDVDIE